MLKRWTVLPAIHIMKPIIIRFLNGDCATSHAFCSHQESTRGSGSRPPQNPALLLPHRASRSRRAQARPGSAGGNHASRTGISRGLTCAFHAASESFRWRAPAASSCVAVKPCEFHHHAPPSERETSGSERGCGAYAVGSGSGEARRIGDGGGSGRGGVVELHRPAASQSLALLHRQCWGVDDLLRRRGLPVSALVRLGSGRAPATAPPELQLATIQLVGR